ncbi:MAG: 23S rRNA (uracil(1939)-C(5))-methyltransferase RlmD [Clostridia bacterium]|jgi:23S rRNA (uracil1939-C5)-methyltransferase|nr:23S rRNA (uracil(1939)-C(5))-methyltransferase RlmD [Clostridia bacterium]
MSICPVEKNKDYFIEINDIGNDGEGIGKINEFTVFVKNVLPGEKVKIKILKVKKHFAYGKVLEILTYSKNRIEPLCQVAKRCGGCTLQHLRYSAQIDFKTKKVYDALTRIGKFNNPDVKKCIGMENPYNYRNKAQYPVGEYKDGLRIGFYAGRSHEIIDNNNCIIQHKANSKIIEIIRNFIQTENISAYNEETGNGLIRHVMTRIGFYTDEILVCIVINAKRLPKEEKLIENLRKIDGLRGIILNINTEKTNVILGRKNIVIWGRDYITDYIGDVKFNISVRSFYQVNPVQTKVLYETALNYAELNGNENVLDLYCGIGTISLFLAQKAKKVIGVEIVPQAIEDAKKNAQINNIQNAEFICGASEEVVPEIYKKGFKADVIVVDPPRKGCDIEVINTILKMKPKKVVYVSCDPATLSRDLKILCEDSYTISKIQPVDQFCFSTHVETVVLMSRRRD